MTPQWLTSSARWRNTPAFELEVNPSRGAAGCSRPRSARAQPLQRQAHDDGVPALAAGAAVVPDAAAYLDEPGLAVHGDRGRVVREDLQAQLVHPAAAAPADGGRDQG